MLDGTALDQSKVLQLKVLVLVVIYNGPKLP